MIEYNFAKEFSKIPGPRYKRLGPHSGEEFREDVLKKWFENDQEVIIDINGVNLTFGPSFISESFVKAAREYGEDKFYKIIHFKEDSEKNITFQKKVKSYIETVLKNDYS